MRKPENENEFLEAALAAAQIGGQILLDWQSKFTVQQKGVNDLVTQADVESEKAIKNFLLKKFPQHQFLGEESVGEHSKSETSDYCWIVDPLDGTTNYVHRLPSFSVSIALRYKNEIVVGVVFDPVLDECFCAAKGSGAFLNGQSIQSSGIEELFEGLLVVSLSTSVTRHSREMHQFQSLMLGCQAFRRLGSAALNLCYIAMGRLDAYWAISLKIWDAAAGVLILQEAGGEIEHVDRKPFELDDPRFVAGASQAMIDNIQRVLIENAEGPTGN